MTTFLSRRLTLTIFALLLAPSLTPITIRAGVTFSVSFPATLRDEPATGRLVVYLHRETAPGGAANQPADGFVEDDPQPIYGVDVSALAPGQTVTLDDTATAFPVKLSDLPPGKYRAQAVLDMAKQNSEWRREPGNLYSDVVQFDNSNNAAAQAPVRIELSKDVKEMKVEQMPAANVEFVTVRSKLLSDFRGADVYLRAGVALPLNYDRNRSYAAVYEVPGFGGDHTMALYKAGGRARRERGTTAHEIASNTFWICLDPESPNGHTLFVDSDNNGPWGKALVSELIPEIEKKFKLIASPGGRIVTGHSSGGWSSLWLATEYPETFGACWSSSPDPVDFRKFEQVNIYAAANFYTDDDGKEISAAQFGGKHTMTTRDENGMEQVLGPRSDTAQQWDSWQACWGRRAKDGSIQPLFDPVSGKIDRAEADSYKRVDIGERLRKDAKRFVPIFRERVRLVCGTDDNYYLNQAVELLKRDLDEIDPPKQDDSRPGYIKLIAGDHSSVFQTREMAAWAGEMMEFLRKGGHVTPPSQPAIVPATGRSQ